MKKGTLEKMTRNALMELAKEFKLVGRSKMNKEELIQALSRIRVPRAKTAPAKKKAAASARKKVGATKAKSAIRSSVGYVNPRKEAAMPDSYQQEVERGRFDLGVEEAPLRDFLSNEEDLPRGYGDNRIVLLVRDPYWLHSYWEVQEFTVQEALDRHGLRDKDYRKIVRLYIGGEANYQDIEVEGLLNDWYINISSPDTDLFVDFGVMVGDRFIALARSNSVRTPRAGASEVVDEKWMSLEEEFRTIYALSGGYRVGEGSLELQEMMERRLWEEISSGAISSFFGSGQFRERQRGFWYHLDAELIVYGATEPDASVTLQGRPIQLRPDGTFSARFALPDGQQDIPVTFESADKIDKATVVPRVRRKTEKF